MDPVTSPECQIHHTHADYRVISFLDSGLIYLFDSFGTDRPLKNILTGSLQTQLAILYGKDK